MHCNDPIESISVSNGGFDGIKMDRIAVIGSIGGIDVDECG